MRLTSSSAIGVLSMLLKSSFGIHSPLNASNVEVPTVGTRFRTMKYSRVKFRKDRDGTVVAFESCGCEADTNTFRPCRMHQEDPRQAATLKAEARYRIIQKCCQLAGHRDNSH